MRFVNNILFMKSILLSNFIRLSFPFKITFAVTYRCNLRCRTCNIWGKGKYDSELSVGEIDSFFKKAGNFSWISVTGGEPFLREDLPEICDTLVNRCRKLSRLHITTNGQLTDKIIDLAAQLRNKYKRLKFVFIVSIDGPSYLHDAIRCKEGAWKNAVTTFLKLKEIAQVKTMVGFTISSHNVGKFEEAYELLKELYPSFSLDDISVNIFQKSGFYYTNEDMLKPDSDLLLGQIKRIISMDKDKFSINNFLRRNYLNLYTEYLKTGKPPLKCQAFSSTCFLSPEGNLHPCCMYDNKPLNVRGLNNSLAAFWNSVDAKRLGYECSQADCPGCWTPCDAFSSIGGSLIKVLRLNALNRQ